MKDGLDFSRLFDNKGNSLWAMNFNNMVPVDERLIKPVNHTPSANDSPQDLKYKDLLSDQLDWCNNNRKHIIRKASRIYQVVTVYPEDNERLVSRCCDFKKLEAALEKYLVDTGLEKPK